MRKQILDWFLVALLLPIVFVLCLVTGLVHIFFLGLLVGVISILAMEEGSDLLIK